MQTFVLYALAARKTVKMRLTRKIALTGLMLAGCSASVWAGQNCSPALALLISGQGQVQALSAASSNWIPAIENQIMCGDDSIHTGELSRAVLRMAVDMSTYMTMDELTLMSFHLHNKRVQIGLERGQAHIRSHTPQSFDVTTPFVNAGIEGTEFLVHADAGQAEVTVFEGRVKVSNALGEVIITNGQTAMAEAGKAPVLKQLTFKPTDAVQWAAYYPPIIDTATLRNAAGNPNIQAALAAYQAGNILKALEALSQTSAEPNADEIVFQIGLLLSLGRVDAAQPLLQQVLQRFPDNSSLYALQALIALAHNDKAAAERHARQAIALAPNNPVAHIAMSYVDQAFFRLDQARQDTEQALRVAPDNALAFCRQAEVLAASGNLEQARQAAQQALQLNPHLARPWIILGFTQLAAADVDAAKQSLDTALKLDASDPLAHFALGLLNIKENNLQEGKELLETATTLDPNNSLLRSYLGKVYYELKQTKIADLQLDLAKAADPQDPTPYYYSAIQKQAQNRPVEAIEDMEQAIELNDNRAVYRSKQLLDSDQAARGAAIGRIYNSVGFEPRALLHAWSALADDPGDFNAHRLLSDSYSALPSSQFARTSEMLQSQLMQTQNITPIQPLLSENSQFLQGSFGPSALSMNEFNPLFNRNQGLTLASGLVGGNNTYSDELVHSGLWDKGAYSLGQYHYQTNGYRQNDYNSADLYNVFAQTSLTSTFNVQAEYKHKSLDSGYLGSSFFTDPVQQQFENHTQQLLTKDDYRVGFNWQPTQQSRVLGSFIHYDQTAPTITQPFNFNYYGNVVPLTEVMTSVNSHADSGELQYQLNAANLKTLLGGGLGQINVVTNNQVPPPPTQITENQYQSNAYIYNYFSFPAGFKWTVASSVNDLRYVSQSPASSITTFNPKVGVMWNVTDKTVLRAAAIKSAKSFAFSDQTIEPTQVAGFNQFFDDFSMSRSARYGVGLDQSINTALKTGVEVSRRDITIPVGQIDQLDTTHESQFRGYLLWMPDSRWVSSLEYYREEYSDLNLFQYKTSTQYIPLSLAYYDPTGWYSRFKATSYFQAYSNLNTEQSGKSDAEFLDLTLGYRLSGRRGIVEVLFQNLLNQNYQYQDYRYRSQSVEGAYFSQLPFMPDFTASARFTLAF